MEEHTGTRMSILFYSAFWCASQFGKISNWIKGSVCIQYIYTSKHFSPFMFNLYILFNIIYIYIYFFTHHSNYPINTPFNYHSRHPIHFSLNGFKRKPLGDGEGNLGKIIEKNKYIGQVVCF